METPITISSSSSPSRRIQYLQLRYNRNKHDGIYPDDSCSSDRKPQSWSTSDKRYNSNSNTHLSNMQKVTDWINSIENADLNRNVNSPSVERVHVKEPEPKSLILVRCDFNKSVPPAQTYFSQLNTFNCSTPLINYFQKDDISLTNSLPLCFEEPKYHEQEKYSKCTTEITRKLSVDKESFCASSKLNDDKSESSLDGYDVPLSIESRKKELCTYLKLMDPSDKKQIFILQNRRSTRVRNLAALQERKQLDKEIKKLENNSEKNQEQEKCLTMKSFKELNIKVNKSTKLEQPHQLGMIEEKRSQENELFHFPFPPSQLMESMEDFDIIMKKTVPRFRRICNKKNINFFSKTQFIKETYLKNKNIKNKQNLCERNYIKIKLCKPKSTKIKWKPKEHISKAALKKLESEKVVVNRKSRKLNVDNTCRKILRSNGKIKNVHGIPIKTFVKPLQKKNKNNTKEWKRTKRKDGLQDNKNMSPTCKSVTFTTQFIEDAFVVASSPKIPKSQCEVLTVSSIPGDNISLDNIIDDLNDFKNLSEEHKQCLIESRILSTKPIINNTITEDEIKEKSLQEFEQELSPLYGFSKSDVSKTEIICETIKNALVKHSETKLKCRKPNIFEEIHLEHREYFDQQKYNNLPKETDHLNSTNDNKIIEHILTSSDKMPVLEDDNLINHNYALLIGKPYYNGNPEENKVPAEKFPSTVNTCTSCTSATLEEITNTNCEEKTLDENNPLELDPRTLPKKKNYKIFPYNKSVEMKSLQKSLQFIKKKNTITIDSNLNQEWDSDEIPKPKVTKQSHYIYINKENGDVLNVFYIDFNLIVCQEFIVSFWMQTPLGNILGSQNMWIPRGNTQRIVLNNKCIQKKSSEMVLSTENTVAYIELWTKEHKSDIREGPVADIFVTLYFWKQRQIGLDKKVLQLANINGFADDVQYCVIKCFPKIIVSWHSANGDNVLKRTFIHAYQLAADYQMISHVSEIEPVDHYVSSLHNIEDCDNLIMGCGENKITLWNLEHGYIIATIELTDIKSSLATLWVKCDRGFLFTLQQCMDKELRLIAINGINHSWKKLASYYPSEGFDRLKGVCIENGLLLSFYDQGILCWKAETGEPIEEISVEADLIPSGSYLILLEENRIFVKHATTHLLSISVEEL